jgi:hypothetical protein
MWYCSGTVTILIIELEGFRLTPYLHLILNTRDIPARPLVVENNCYTRVSVMPHL